MCAGVTRRKSFPDSDLAADAAVLAAVTAMLYLALSPERRSCPYRREEVDQEMWFGLLPSSALCIRLDAGIGKMLIPGIPYFFGEELLRHLTGSLFFSSLRSGCSYRPGSGNLPCGTSCKVICNHRSLICSRRNRTHSLCSQG